MDAGTRIMEPVPAEDEIRITATTWLDEVEVDRGARSSGRPARATSEHRERIDTPRVRHLFPVPEDADWEVGELEYDHYGRRAELGPSRRQRRPLGVAREQVAVDLGQAGEVVDVLVQVGDADHAAAPQLASRGARCCVASRSASAW